MKSTKLAVRHGLRSGAAAIGALMLFAGPAMAQETGETDADEIIVTAQKREQSMSDVSLSVSAVGEEKLAETNTVGIEGLQNIVPSISFGNDFNFALCAIENIFELLLDVNIFRYNICNKFLDI